MRETLTLLTCAHSSIVSKNQTNQTKIFGSDLEHFPVFKAVRGENPRVKNLPRMTIHKLGLGVGSTSWRGEEVWPMRGLPLIM